MYTKHAKRPREGVRWRRSKRILKCPGTLITAVNYADFHRITIEHNHADDRGEVEVHKAYAKMKRRAAVTKDKPKLHLGRHCKVAVNGSESENAFVDHREKNFTK